MKSLFSLNAEPSLVADRLYINEYRLYELERLSILRNTVLPG